MTVDEMVARESIRDTLARYNMAGDRLKADALAATFTMDGILESEGVPEQDAFRYEGRNAIREWMERWSAASATPPTGDVRVATFVRHHLSTCLIELSGADAAQVRTYWTAYTDIGADHGGLYVDRFRRRGDAWLIAHRKVRLDWRAPGSLFHDVVLRTRPG